MPEKTNLPEQNTLPRTSRIIILVSHLAVLLTGAWLLTMTSIDTFSNLSLNATPHLLKVQFIISAIFISDIFIEIIFSKRTWKGVAGALAFIPLCLPWVNLLLRAGIHPDDVIQFVVGLLPFIRIAWVLTAVLRAFHLSAAPSLLTAYLMIAGVTLYVSSMMFYVAEAPVNPDIHSYRSAVYWACMSATTTGSSITECTVVGQVLSGVLACMGLILLPVFTIYIANAASGPDNQKDNQS